MTGYLCKIFVYKNQEIRKNQRRFQQIFTISLLYHSTLSLYLFFSGLVPTKKGFRPTKTATTPSTFLRLTNTPHDVVVLLRRVPVDGIHSSDMKQPLKTSMSDTRYRDRQISGDRKLFWRSRLSWKLVLCVPIKQICNLVQSVRSKSFPKRKRHMLQG